MKRILTMIVLCLLLPFAAGAQTKKAQTKRPAATQTSKKKSTATKKKTTTKKVESSSDLRSQKDKVKRNLQNNQSALDAAKRDAKTKAQQVAFIEQQMSDRAEYIHRLQHEIDSVDEVTTAVETSLDSAETALQRRKDNYAESLRYARKQRRPGSKMMFVVAADSWQQRIQRAHYAHRFAASQVQQGHEIQALQRVLMERRSQLLACRGEMDALLQEISHQRNLLAQQHREQQEVLRGLKTRQQTLSSEIARQQKQLADLDRRIDEAINRELEAERRRLEEAERRRQAEAAKRKGGNTGSASNSSRASNSSNSSRASGSSSTPLYNSAADIKLTGTFEQNKGSLPYPVTGKPRREGKLGVYSPMPGVTLQRNGVDYVGAPGAYAVSVFDGVVTQVFSTDNLQNVIVRHGSYMTVYCNLTAVRVAQGQKLKAGDYIGSPAKNDKGEPTLHFQVRKERVVLNPVNWIKK